MSATTYCGRTFTGSPGREAIEIVGADDVLVDLCRFSGGSTCLRLTECGRVHVVRSVFAGMTGPADPDGQAIQVIRPRGPHVISQCVLTAAPNAEDLISIFADQPCTGTVEIDGCSWIGAGTSGSSTSLCLDGPCCPPVTVVGGRIQAARCGITIAGGSGHTIKGVRFVACGTRVYVFNGYGRPPSGVHLIGLDAGALLLGEGMPAGAVLTRAA